MALLRRPPEGAAEELERRHPAVAVEGEHDRLPRQAVRAALDLPHGKGVEVEVLQRRLEATPVGFLEAGRIKPGMDLGVGRYPDGLPRALQAIELFARAVQELAAGREPIQAALFWRGHLNIEVGSVLTVSPATAST
jgi:hypothetical protein